MSQLRVLLTNDDGIDSPGLHALADALAPLAEVTTVAPATNQSGVGRERSKTVSAEEHDRGTAIDGTPADCVAYALRGLETEFDLVVSGCNLGPNVGSYLLGRSGTVGAAVEAAFLGVPAIAVSGYHHAEFFPPEGSPYEFPGEATAFLAERALNGEFEGVDYLNVNAPIEGRGPMRVTEPVGDYDTAVDPSGEELSLQDTFWARAETNGSLPDLAACAELYPIGSDRRAIAEGEVSVSPFRVPQSVVESDALSGAVGSF
ncbi:5'/3'-nucleotidase SurE [Natronorarus salvus]|uniref:5'/3'-nucleotidase SurE n=1 Tax=Natronorarus salvus TaxID=3117733 RepID=UPI002F25EEB4